MESSSSAGKERATWLRLDKVTRKGAASLAISWVCFVLIYAIPCNAEILPLGWTLFFTPFISLIASTVGLPRVCYRSLRRLRVASSELVSDLLRWGLLLLLAAIGAALSWVGVAVRC